MKIIKDNRDRRGRVFGYLIYDSFLRSILEDQRSKERDYLDQTKEKVLVLAYYPPTKAHLLNNKKRN